MGQQWGILDNGRKFDLAKILHNPKGLSESYDSVVNLIKSRLIVVPAAAGIRVGLALYFFTRRKRYVGSKLTLVRNFLE